MSSSPKDNATPHGWLVPLSVALTAGLVAAGGTFALWHDSDATDAQLVSSGDLKVSSLEKPVWHETSPDVSSTPRIIQPDTFLVRPGDTLAVAIPFETTLRGDNLATELRVDWADGTSVPPGVTGTYMLLDTNDTPLLEAPLKLGEATDFAAVDGGQYQVRVDLDFSEMNTRFGADDVDPLGEYGSFDVEIHQVRPLGGA